MDTQQFHGYDWHELVEAFGILPYEEDAPTPVKPNNDVQLLEFDTMDAYMKACGPAYQQYLRDLGNYEDRADEDQYQKLVEYIVENSPVTTLRWFLQALARESRIVDFYWPVWDGLLAINDDLAFLQMFVPLIRLMWT